MWLAVEWPSATTKTLLQSITFQTFSEITQYYCQMSIKEQDLTRMSDAAILSVFILYTKHTKKCKYAHQRTKLAHVPEVFIIKTMRSRDYFKRVTFALQVHLRTINYTFLFLQALALAVSRVIPVPTETAFVYFQAFRSSDYCYHVLISGSI